MADLQTIQEKQEDLLAQHCERVATLENQMQAKQSNLSILQSSIAPLDARIKKLEDAAIIEELDKLKEKVSGLIQTQLARSDLEYHYHYRISQLELDRASAKVTLFQHATDINRHTDEIQELHASIASMASDISKIKQQFSKLEQNVDDLIPRGKITEKIKALLKKRYKADNLIYGVFGKPLTMDKQGGYVNLQMIFSGKIAKQQEKKPSDPHSNKPETKDHDPASVTPPPR